MDSKPEKVPIEQVEKFCLELLEHLAGFGWIEEDAFCCEVERAYKRVGTPLRENQLEAALKSLRRKGLIKKRGSWDWDAEFRKVKPPEPSPEERGQLELF